MTRAPRGRAPSSRARGSIVALASIALVAAPRVARADKAEPPPGVSITAAPTLGASTLLREGWSEVTVRIANGSPRPIRGGITLSSRAPFFTGEAFVGTARYAVDAGSVANVRLPVILPGYAELTAIVTDEAGVAIREQPIVPSSQSTVLLVSVEEGMALRLALDDVWVAPTTLATPAGSGSPQLMSVDSPRFDPATGDPVLPLRASGWTAASAVLIRSDVLTRLAGPELDALAGYVLAGGTLAIATARPEDARSPTLVALVGGTIERVAAPPELFAELVLEPAIAAIPRKEIPFQRQPAASTAPTLVGHVGGNLRPSVYGSSAYYGLGEVHLLAFDPTRTAADPWVQARMVDLTRRGFDRRASLTYKHGGAQSDYGAEWIRRQLDPNETSRWATFAAAALLCVYAIVAGPINFGRAARRGRPLRALVWLPILAVVAFVGVVLVGVAAKGVHGRARHLTLVEAGAGMTVGTARRWRGFYSPSAQDLVIAATDARSVLSLPGASSQSRATTQLAIDREGLRLVEAESLPWETLVVREDGFASLGEGIAIVPLGSGDARIENRSGHAMRAVILALPRGATPLYFARIEDGEDADAATGHVLDATTDERDWVSDMQTVRPIGDVSFNPLAAHKLGPILEGDAPGLAAAWGAIEDSAGGETDWLPNDVPVLLAQLDGGEGQTEDAGLRIESDRLLVRVVGFGGKP